MHQEVVPLMRPYVAEFRQAHTQTIASSSMAAAAAVAQAIADSTNCLVHAVYTQEEYAKLQLERTKGKTVGKS
jgi:C4-dicarboxylate-specific signal transduction histidine kinase